MSHGRGTTAFSISSGLLAAKAVVVVLVLLLLSIVCVHTTPRTAHAFGIVVRRPTGKRRASDLKAFPFGTAGGLVLSDAGVGVGAVSAVEGALDAVVAEITTTTTTDAATGAAFTDRIDPLLGDPAIRTLFLVFGGVVVVLAGLSVLSQKVDAAIESVVGDFETVLRTDPEFRSAWAEEIEPRLKPLDNEVDKALLRKQKLFEIMEEMQETEPALMKRINTKMEALNTTTPGNNRVT